jgi:hypothetical protein
MPDGPAPPPVAHPDASHLTFPASAPADASLDLEALEQLARKYRALGELRRARARGEAIPDKAVFRALAQEFPGALSELDNLPLDEIDRRGEALRAAHAGGPAERWMPWMHRYHALMRAALYVKIRVARAPDLAEAEAESLATKATAHARVPVGPDFVRAVKAPPAGRLKPLVLERLSAAFGAPSGEIRDALFPRRAR